MNKKQLLEVYEKYAESKGWKINSDKKHVDWILTRLLINGKKHGFRYCPCKIITKNKEKDKEIICPCKDHEIEVEKEGKCHCGLFVK
jgi:ferredoxin-thioredoxin reductase catalytic subunit